MFITSCYSTTSQRVFEGDSLSVFGIMHYNASADEFTIDNPIAFMQNGDRSLLTTEFTKDVVKSVANAALYLFATVVTLGLTSKMIKSTYEFYKRTKAKKQAEALSENDNQNKIEGAPQQTRSLNGVN